MADRVCRLCKTKMNTQVACSLFSSSGVKQKWAPRISALLDVPEPSPVDTLPSHICGKCRTRIVSLEKALADLSVFKQLARSSLEGRGVKRTKETSGSVGVSPDTLRQRPPSKLSKKRLTFQALEASESSTAALGPFTQSLVGLPMGPPTAAQLPIHPLLVMHALPERGEREVNDHLVDIQRERLGVEVEQTVAVEKQGGHSDANTSRLPPSTSEHISADISRPTPTSCADIRRPSLSTSQSSAEFSRPSSENVGGFPPLTSGRPHPPPTGEAKTVKVVVSTPSRAVPYIGQLSGAKGKLARALLGENTTSIAKAALSVPGVKEAITTQFMGTLNQECRKICRVGTRACPESSLFRSIPVGQCAQFRWRDLMAELEQNAPFLLSLVQSMVTRNDCRNKIKVGAAHFPGICMAVAVILKERNREMCGIQGLLSLLMYSCHCEKQVYARLNHLNICVSYSATLRLMDQVGQLHTVPIQAWIKENAVIKFWGDNVDKQRGVRDYRSDHHGEMVHMYSLLVGRSRTPAPELSHSGNQSELKEIPIDFFLPHHSDVVRIKSNLVVLVSRLLTQYFPALSFLAKVVPKHIRHKYSRQMAQKSEVAVLDVLMKNETKHTDMVDIMSTMQDYLGDDYPQDRQVASGGDHLTCERQIGAQRHMMDGNTPRERLEVLEPVVEDWHCQLCIITMMWKALYGKSAGDHGTLAFFRIQLRRTAVTSDPKKDVDACVDLVLTVLKGHILQAACDVLKVDGLESSVKVPTGLAKASKAEKLSFISDIAQEVVERCTLVEGAFFGEDITDTRDGVYNYTRVFCHFAAILLEYRDGWGEGDGERGKCVWKLLMPHFKAAGHTKYALQALRLQIQLATLSPNLAHQVQWNRSVNTHGGLGHNIPCDLHNEHVNKLVKHFIQNMGPNLTDTALHRAARSVTALNAFEQRFDSETGVPYRSSGHSTKSDNTDVKKVMATVKKHQLLTQLDHREHRSFPGISLNPLAKWDIGKTKQWVQEKRKEYLKYKGKFRSEVGESSGVSLQDHTEDHILWDNIADEFFSA